MYLSDGPSAARDLDEETQMRVMVLVKSSVQQEAPKWDDPAVQARFAAMARFNAELADAGVMLAGEGLAPPRESKQIRFAGGSPTITDGPFAEAKEVIGGFWIWQVSSMDEAVDWVKKAPFEAETIELRRVSEEADLTEVLPPEAVAAEAKLREQVAQQQSH